jgi:hypothetical protein
MDDLYQIKINMTDLSYTGPEEPYESARNRLKNLHFTMHTNRPCYELNDDILLGTSNIQSAEVVRVSKF